MRVASESEKYLSHFYITKRLFFTSSIIMSLKTELYLYIIAILGVSTVYTSYCPEGFHPYTDGLSCIQFEINQSLNYSSALFQAAKNDTSGLAEAFTIVDLQTLFAYATSILDNPSNTLLWVSCPDCVNNPGDMMNCPVLLNNTIQLVNCSFELGYILQISYNIENVSRTIQDPVYVPPNGFLLELPYPFNSSDYSIIWIFNDVNLNSSAIVLPDNSLMFQTFSVDDVGIYKAFANNGFNRALIFTVDLQQAVFLEPAPQPRNITIPEGHLGVFECSSPDSRPVPVTSWYNSTNHPITTGGRFFVSPLGTLYIREVITNDSGTYYCSLGNTAGMAFLSATLEVLNRTINGDTVQARFIQSPRNQTVLEDESATLECTITSNHIMTPDEISTVTTYLFKVGLSFVDTVVYLPYFARDVYPSVQYQVNNGPGDVRCQGQITIATLGTFSANSDSGTLTPNVRATITSISSDAFVSLGESVQLNCSFIGIPAPTVQWYFNGYPYNVTSSSSNNNASMITINIDNFDMSNSGTYQCVVINKHSVSTAPVVLLAKDGRPGAVGVSLSIVDETSIKVTWSSPLTKNTISPLLLRYVITWRCKIDLRRNTETATGKVTLPYTESNYIIQQLRAGSEYEIGISVINSQTEGPVTYKNIMIPALLKRTTTVNEQPRSIPSTIITTPLLVMSSTRTTIATSILPSIGGVGTFSDESPLYVLGAVIFVGLVLVFIIIGSSIAVYAYWNNKGWTRGSYSPSKTEEQNQRQTMLSIESQPVTPPPPLTPLSTTGGSINSGSVVSVEVIKVDRLYSSKDVLCTPDSGIYDRIQKKQEFFPLED